MQVKVLIVNHLFDRTSDTTDHIANFISKYHDNVNSSLMGEEAWSFIRNSVRVSSLEVTVPKTKVTATVYNVYIYPLTAKPTPLESWRKFIAGQQFYAEIYGMGVKYQYSWRCIHCKSIDHPAGLCPLVRRMIEGREAPNNAPLLDDELLPLPLEPTPGPSNRPQNPNHGKRTNVKGRGAMPGTQQKNKRPVPQTRTNEVRTAGPKKRKIH